MVQGIEEAKASESRSDYGTGDNDDCNCPHLWSRNVLEPIDEGDRNDEHPAPEKHREDAAGQASLWHCFLEVNLLGRPVCLLDVAMGCRRWWLRRPSGIFKHVSPKYRCFKSFHPTRGCSTDSQVAGYFSGGSVRASHRCFTIQVGVSKPSRLKRLRI